MWWMEILLTICVSITFAVILALCLCWRKKSPNNDLLGLDGMVTQKNPDENVNHLPSAAHCIVDGLNAATATAAGDNESNKRAVPQTNTRRSLPDIPSEQVDVNWEPTVDNSSEHYATVGQFQNAKRHTLPNGIEARPSISQHSSISQADSFSPYEKVKYDKIKSKENPYAQLQPSTSRQAAVLEESQIPDERTNLLRVDGTSSSLEPSAPPRSRRSSTHSGLGVDIPAASAVAGGIAASSELPYMTPPITQSNFSGDSQDSSKGYTSISVREPLANILAQTKELNKKREVDQHYSTVLDDSEDDVYTTIPDPNNQIYTSESETYARIPAHPITVEAEVNHAPSRCREDSDELYELAPEPALPNVKQGTSQGHSRQASSSSSIANIGSPKPEKRQANSPLPPPPDVQPPPKNIDDLYAKVQKNKKKDEPDGEITPEKPEPLPISPPIKRREHNYETLRKVVRQPSDPGYEKILKEEPGYASINGPESITGSDPGYEVLKQRAPSDVDPNYEKLKHQDSTASDCDGYSKIKYDGYSIVNKRQKSEEKSSSCGSNSQDFSIDEPNYESMPSESDPNYESVPNYERIKDLEEPPYEKVHREEGYEKVKARGYENIDTSESSNGDVVRTRARPVYTELQNDTDSEVPGYESIKKNVENNSSSESSSGESKSNDILDEDGIFQV